MTAAAHESDAGFSLIEALVALAILAVAAAALITAAEQHVRRIGQLEARSGALWAAQNHLAVLQAGAAPEATIAQMGGARYAIATELFPTDDPAIQRVRIRVGEAGRDGDLAVLDGFAPAPEPGR